MVDVDISIVFAGLSIAASIVYYASVLRNANQTRQRELIFLRSQGYTLEYTQSFNEVMMMTDWETPEEWEEKYYRTNNVETFSKWHYITGLYRMAGVLMKQGADPDIIFTLYPEGSVISLWDQYESVIQHLRESYSSSYLEDLEYLYIEAKKRRPEIHWQKER